MKKRIITKNNYFFDLPFELILHIFSFIPKLRLTSMRILWKKDTLSHINIPLHL